MEREIILADNAGFCFGVQRAVDTALKHSGKESIHTIGQLIHNNDVVERLKNQNIFPINLDEVDTLNSGNTIIIRSHGVSENIYNILKDKKLNVIDATCPYVSNIHKKVKKYVALGYKIVIVGDLEHPEVIGINGWCDNSAIISKDGTNLINIPNKVCVVAQTTEKQENWIKVLDIIIRISKDIVALNTICSATEARQKSAEKLSKAVDVMVVIGGRHSSNTTKLYEICKNNCKNTILVENSTEIPDNIVKSKEFIKFGVTAGASTPDWVIKEAIKKMFNNEEMTMDDVMQMFDDNNVQIIVGDKIKGKVVSITEDGVYLNIQYKAEAFLPKAETTLTGNATLNDIFKIDDVIEAKILNRKNEEGNVVVSIVEIKKDGVSRELTLAFENKTLINVTISAVVKGGVISLYKDVIRIFIPASQISNTHIQDLNTCVGESFDVELLEFESKFGKLKAVASRKAVLKKAKEEKSEEAFKTIEPNTIVEGEVKRTTDFGAFIEVNGVDGLAHISEIAWGKLNKVTDAINVGDKVKVFVISVDRENKKLSLSIKRTIENPWNNVEEKYPVGSTVIGKVARFAPFGAFVELEAGVDGLVHISQISYNRVNKVEEVLTIGEEIKAVIIATSGEKRKIELSIKEVNPIDVTITE